MTDADRELPTQPKTKWVPISDFLGVMIAAQKNEWSSDF